MLVRKPMIPDFPLSAWNKCTLQEARASQVTLVVKNIPANGGDIRDEGLIPGLGNPLEEGMAMHSSILAWRIPWTEEPGKLQSIASWRVRHNWSDLAHAHT